MNASKQGYLFQGKSISLPSLVNLLIMWFEGDVLPINLVNVCDIDTEDDDDCDDSGVDDGQGVYDSCKTSWLWLP